MIHIDALSDCFIRSGVYERLLKAAASLPSGMYLTVLDGWRPPSVQIQLYQSLSQAIAAANPGCSGYELAELTRQFVSVPSITKENQSPHLTGGAVDVTLTDSDGQWLDMGSEFDAACAASYTRHFETIEAPSERQVVLRTRRRILFNAMQDAGFTTFQASGGITISETNIGLGLLGRRKQFTVVRKLKVSSNGGSVSYAETHAEEQKLDRRWKGAL